MDLTITEVQQELVSENPCSLPDLPDRRPVSGKPWTLTALCLYVRYARPWWHLDDAVQAILVWWEEKAGRSASEASCRKAAMEVVGLIALRGQLVKMTEIGVSEEELFAEQRKRGLPETPIQEWPQGGECLVPHRDTRLSRIRPVVRGIAKAIVEEKGFVLPREVLDE